MASTAAAASAASASATEGRGTSFAARFQSIKGARRNLRARRNKAVPFPGLRVAKSMDRFRRNKEVIETAKVRDPIL